MACERQTYAIPQQNKRVCAELNFVNEKLGVLNCVPNIIPVNKIRTYAKFQDRDKKGF